MRKPQPKYGLGFFKRSKTVSKSVASDDIVVWQDPDYQADSYLLYGGKDSSFAKFMRAFNERHGIGGNKKREAPPLDYDACEAQRTAMHNGAMLQWESHPPRPNTDSETDIRNFNRDPKPEIVPEAHLSWGDIFDAIT